MEWEWVGYAGMAVVGIVVLFLAAIGGLRSFRGLTIGRVRDLESRVPPVSSAGFVSAVAVLARVPLLPGHTVELLCDGNETVPRLWADLAAARRSITMQVYYARPGRMAAELKAILIDRARAGVRVLLLFDAIGAGPLPESYFEELREAGVDAVRLRTVRPWSLHRAQHRWHSRAVVVDGSIGYTGGFGIADDWYGDGRTPGQWREINARVVGPAVLELQGAVVEAWTEERRTLPEAAPLLPERDGSGGPHVAGVLFSGPGTGSTRAERLIALSTAAARERLLIWSSYFVPDRTLEWLLRSAARRGVDVRILTASERTDLPVVRLAGRATYGRLLESGVRIWEYQPTMMHAKGFVVDGVWCIVGAHNFDVRSAVLNEETSVLVRDGDLGARMEAMFMDDQSRAEEILLERWRRRPVREKVAGALLSTLERVL